MVIDYEGTSLDTAQETTMMSGSIIVPRTIGRNRLTRGLIPQSEVYSGRPTGDRARRRGDPYGLSMTIPFRRVRMYPPEQRWRQGGGDGSPQDR